jgi:hypothetical protein
MVTLIISIIVALISLVGMGFLIFGFVREAIEYRAFNKQSKQLRGKSYGDDNFYGNSDRFN